MVEHSSLIDGMFSPCNTLNYVDPLVECFKRADVDQVCSRSAVLGDENRFMISFEIRDDLCGFGVEGRHEFSSHEVIL